MHSGAKIFTLKQVDNLYQDRIKNNYGGGGWIDRVADMNMLKCYVPPSLINSNDGTTGINNSH